MTNDYSDIGFRINDEADFSALHAAYPEQLTRRRVVYGEEVELFSPDGRAELWFYSDLDGEYGGNAEPGYHSGRSTEVVPWVLLPGAMLEVETGVCRMTVALPGAFLWPSDLDKPRPMELTLFARNLAVYEDADDYMVKRKGSTAPESVIPFGSFSLSGKEEELEPDPVADVSGVVTEVTLRENPVHHGRYYEIGLSCLGVDFTVVADAELFPAPPQAGNILKGFYWVSGRIPD